MTLSARRTVSAKAAGRQLVPVATSSMEPTSTSVPVAERTRQTGAPVRVAVTTISSAVSGAVDCARAVGPLNASVTAGSKNNETLRNIDCS
jgi:hypothetical protein